MLKNYIIIAIRNIQRNKFFSFINIFGLAMGITVATLVMLWIMDEVNYDTFYPDHDQVFLIESHLGKENKKVIWGVTPDKLGDVIQDDFPEIESVVKLDNGYGISININNQSFACENFYYASSNITEMFNIKMIKGNSTSAFSDPLSIILSEDNSIKLFGDLNSIGEVILVNGKYNLTVTGIMENPPLNTHRPIEYIVPYKFLDMTNRRSNEWGRFDFYTYIKIRKNASVADLNAKLLDYLQKYNIGTSTKLLLRPVKDIHLYAPYGSGNIDNVIIFGIIGSIMLLVGCINFVNLSTSQAARRHKEIGVRKTVGAIKNELVKQFVFESFVTILIAVVISIILIQILLVPFNLLTEKNLEYSSLFNIEAIGGLFLIVFLTTIVSSFYPAFYLSRFNPFIMFKNKSNSLFSEIRIRKILTFTQFFVATLLVVSVILISKQMKYIQNKNLGFDKQQLLWVKTNYLKDDLVPFKNKVEELSRVVGTSVISQLPINMNNFTWLSKWEGNASEKSVMFNVMSIDANFLPLMKIELQEGENFREQGINKSGIIINNEALKQTGLQNPIGKRISNWGKDEEIVGVIKDFHNKPLREKVTPIIMYHNPGQKGYYLLVKIKAGDVAETINTIENIYAKFITTSPFIYSFLDENIDNLYKAEMKIQTILNYLTMLTILIASIGLLGLSIHTAERKRKEIGIRKILGAPLHYLLVMMSKEFVVIVFISVCIASPVAYYLIDKWLQNFAYKVNIDLITFIYAGSLIILLALSTVSIQAIKAAMANPVESLRDE